MLWPVGVLAVLSAIGGLLQWTQFWHPLTDWLDPVARADCRAERHARSGSPRHSRWCSASAGSGLRTWPMRAKTLTVPKPVKLFEKKFYWDELYDAVFYRPADLIARGLGRFVEQPLDPRDGA